MEKKKKILFHSAWSKSKTGYAHNTRETLKYLYSTGKYDIVEYANGLPAVPEAENKTPWRCRGSIPAHLVNDKNLLADRSASSYGSLLLDKVLQEEKPDFYICAEDIWGMPIFQKPYFNKIPTLCWITLDSLPLRDVDIELCSKTQNLWVWSPFAERALKEKGVTHVETVSGLIGNSKFFPYKDEEKALIRRSKMVWKNGENPDDYTIFGFVFRNQLRKLAPRLIEGFKDFQNKIPNQKVKLLFHTNFAETNSWDIPKVARELGVSLDNILCSYKCKSCKGVYVASFEGLGVQCRACGAKNSAYNPSISEGVTTEELNIIYNMMDAYIHPVTSGGLEIPMCEAMWVGLPCATPNYTYGEDFISSGYVTPLEFDHYWEVFSNYKKANPTIESISNFIRDVHFQKEKYKQIGLRGREWAINRFNVNEAGKKLEKLIDESNCDFDYNSINNNRSNENFEATEDIVDNEEWARYVLGGFYPFEKKENLDSAASQYATQLNLGSTTRKRLVDSIRIQAQIRNVSIDESNIANLIKKTEKLKIVYVMPESFGDCIISLSVLRGIKDTYPVSDLYVCTKRQNFEIFNPFVGSGFLSGVLPYMGEYMDNYKFWEGAENNKGFVDICFLPYILTQRIANYIHNGKDKNDLQPKRSS